MGPRSRQRKADPPTAVLRIFTVYWNPADAPGLFVVRGSIVDSASRIINDEKPLALATSLDAARAHLPPGLVMLARAEDDDPIIVECWV